MATAKVLAEDPAADPAPADPAPEVVHDAMPPELSPDPFDGSTNLDTSGDVIVCTDNGVQGPTPKDGEDKYTAWNRRAGSDASEDPTADAVPDADPTATAKAFKNITDAKAGYTTNGKKSLALLAHARKASATAKAAKADAQALRVNLAEALKGKADAEASLAKETKAHADYKGGETVRVNNAAQRILSASGVPPVQTAANTEGNANPTKIDKPKLVGLAKVTAEFREQINSKN